jgi:galactose mutarotase-like enzyme
MDIHRLRSRGHEANVSLKGAELQSLRLGGVDLLWNAGPLWPRHAPLLFPIVGALKGDVLRHNGANYTMPKHGFARDRDFTWIHRTQTRCTLELTDDAETRSAYPFPFRLRVSYELVESGLRMEVMLQNPGDRPLPASLGLHPAFRWPLDPKAPKAAHCLTFEADEPGALRRLDAQGLLTPERQPSPILGRALALREDLFADDALIFLEPRSRSLQFGSLEGPLLTLRWEGFPHLGIWTKPVPGPAFLCIEPWAGHASPADWDGEFKGKPGSFALRPGETRHWTFSAELLAGN